MPGFEKYKDRNYTSRQVICECCNQLVSKGTRDDHQSRLKKRDRGAEEERLEGEGSKRARHMNEDQESENEGRGGDLVIDDEPRGEDVEDDIEQRSQQMSSQGLRHGVSGGNLLVAGDERGNRNSAEPPNSQMQHRAPSSLSQAPSTVDSLPDANDSDADDREQGRSFLEMKTKPPATRIKVVMVKVMVGMEAVETKAMTLASGQRGKAQVRGVMKHRQASRCVLER
ncbi:hypothetical protein L202_08088 [Cryptococcus amylolentus CBS 6039]|uniref:Uncharacterized protein n=1 Tax=Cryptococcus amylolentus CBS 6039 TaxID=1295533 RepID=A0A1E3HB68_9TREE|nr:hypothetical protein L202_08088 [Cryptococcus amylolentus CBS 6039]ODN73588.1 hypothetical protein L202_08088 [Cryptococcus amylolentus CBS 6039]